MGSMGETKRVAILVFEFWSFFFFFHLLFMVIVASGWGLFANG